MVFKATGVLHKKMRVAHKLLFFTALIGLTKVGFSVPSARAYFPLSPDLSEFLWEKFNVRCEPGLYLTDQWQAKGIAPLRQKRFEEEVRNISLTYLRDDKTIRDLFRGSTWKGTDAELSARAGWVDRTDLPTRMKQLWLEKSNHERWLLYEYPVGSFPSKGRSPTRLMGLPKHFIRADNTMLSFNNHWWMWFKSPSGDMINKFEVLSPPTQNLSIKAWTKEFTLEDGSIRELPVLHHAVAQRKLLVAVWPLGALPGNGDTPPNEADIIALDLDSGVVRRVLSAQKWPFLIDAEGVWGVRSDDVRGLNELLFRRVNWATSKVGKLETAFEVSQKKGRFHFLPHRYWYSEKGDGDFVFTPEGAKVRLRIPEVDFQSLSDPDIVDNLREFDQLPERATELLTGLRAGLGEPRSFDADLNESLAVALSKENGTWANVIYEDGMFAEESVKSFLWGLDTSQIDAGATLQSLDAAFSFQSKEYFGNRPEADVKDILERTLKVIDGTRSFLFLRDFPVAEAQQVAQPEVQANLQHFVQVMKRCTSAGTCRIITTMRREVYDTLNKSYPSLLAQMNNLRHPNMNETERLAVSRIIAFEIGESKGMVLSQPGFARAMKWCETEKAEAGSSKKASPGYEEKFLEKLFELAQSSKTRSPDQNLSTLGADFIKRLEQDRISNGQSASFRRIDFAKLNVFLKRNTAGKSHHAVIDEITTALEAQSLGTRPPNEGPPAFVLVGNSGVGKSHIALLVSRYLAAEGDEQKALLMDDDEGILFDMGFEAGSSFQIDPKSTQATRLKNAPDGSIVIFDDIQKAERKSSIAVIGQILDKGYYARGNSEQINFAKVGAIFLTTTWGAHLINEGALKDGTFKEKFQHFLVEDPTGPKIDEGLWGRFSSNLYPLANLWDWDLLEAAFIYGRTLNVRYLNREGIDIRVDPALFPGFLQLAKEQKGQARDIVKAMVSASSVAAKLIRSEGVSKILITRSKSGKFMAKTDLDPDFEADWVRALSIYRAYEDKGIDAYLESLARDSTNSDLKQILSQKNEIEENPGASQ